MLEGVNKEISVQLTSFGEAKKINTKKTTKEIIADNKVIVGLTGAAALAAAVTGGILLHKSHKLTKEIEKLYNMQINNFKLKKNDSDFTEFFDPDIAINKLKEIMKLPKNERLAALKEAGNHDRGMIIYLKNTSGNYKDSLPQNIQDAIAEKDYLKTKKLFIEYCDTLLHDSKTAGKTIAESVENVFGKNSGIEPHTYDLTKEGEAIAISANGGAGFHHKILIKGNKEASGLNHKTSKEYVSDLYSPGVLGKMPKDNPSKPVITSGEFNGHKYVAVSYRDHISGYHDEGIGQGFTLYSAKGGDLTPAQQDLLSIGEKLTEEDLSPHMFAISQDSNYDAILSLVQTLAQKYKA